MVSCLLTLSANVFWLNTMEKLACLGLLDPGCKTENVYVQLLETINKKEFTARSITVTIVDALSDIVYVAKSKTDKALYLYFWFFVFAFLTHGNIIFDILEQSSFQKYTTWWVFLALCNMLYLCICVFVYLCICIWVGKVTARPIWPKKCQSAIFNFLIWAT